VEADGAVARVVRHSHHPSKATIETRAMPNVSRARTRSAKQIHRDRQYSLSLVTEDFVVVVAVTLLVLAVALRFA